MEINSFRYFICIFAVEFNFMYVFVVLIPIAKPNFAIIRINIIYKDCRMP